MAAKEFAKDPGNWFIAIAGGLFVGLWWEELSPERATVTVVLMALSLGFGVLLKGRDLAPIFNGFAVLATIGFSGLIGYLLFVWPEDANARMERKIDQLPDQLGKLLAESSLRDAQTREETLLPRYPLGYVIYGRDASSTVIPYESRLNDFEIGRVAAAFEGNLLRLNIWNIVNKRKGGSLTHSTIVLEFPVGQAPPLGEPLHVLNMGGVGVWAELLRREAETLIFVLGFRDRR